MSTEHERRGAVEALERLLNRGGDADDVLRGVVQVLFGLYAYAGIDFVEGERLVTGPSLGTPDATASRYPIVFDGVKVAELVAGSPAADDDSAFLERVATIISPYCLVGWDTGGEAWSP